MGQGQNQQISNADPSGKRGKVRTLRASTRGGHDHGESGATGYSRIVNPLSRDRLTVRMPPMLAPALNVTKYRGCVVVFGGISPALLPVTAVVIPRSKAVRQVFSPQLAAKV